MEDEVLEMIEGEKYGDCMVEYTQPAIFVKGYRCAKASATHKFGSRRSEKECDLFAMGKCKFF